MSIPYPVLRLKAKEDRRIKGGHLWIYSNEIDIKATPLKNFQPGQLVRIENHRGEFLGIGYVNPNTLLAVRLLTGTDQKIDQQFFIETFQQALQLRQRIFSKPFYRWIFGEGDYLPGLIVDRYKDILVVQINTAGMELLQNEIVAALQALVHPQAILLRNDSGARRLEGLESYVRFINGETSEPILLEENNSKFMVPIITGQKTGWFYDHRDNRARLQKYVKDQRVLDVFSYLGAWGITAAILGAKEVVCIDSSAAAIKLLQQNAQLNNVSDKTKTITADAFVALKDLIKNKEKFDVVIVDPPAFIKKRKDLKEGLIAYQRINEMAVQLLAPNGILISSSCSLHFSEEMLLDLLRRVSVKLQRNLQILERGFQALDHPVHPAIPETAYLKAIFCRVD